MRLSRSPDRASSLKCWVNREMLGELALAFRLAKGYRLHPWDSPYLKWRIETWAGIPAESVTKEVFMKFAWQHRADLWRYLRWASRRGM